MSIHGFLLTSCIAGISGPFEVTLNSRNEHTVKIDRYITIKHDGQITRTIAERIRKVAGIVDYRVRKKKEYIVINAYTMSAEGFRNYCERRELTINMNTKYNGIDQAIVYGMVSAYVGSCVKVEEVGGITEDIVKMYDFSEWRYKVRVSHH